jgi:hypothetical protein
MSGPRLHAICHRQIPGDLALLRLAQQRFTQAGLGAEFYPESPEALTEELACAPAPPASYTIHLPRHLRVLDSRSHDQILAFATRFADRAYGMVVHDQPEITSHFAEYVAAARALDQRLAFAGPGPWVFIEYAAGLETDLFVRLFQALRDCRRISACIDISHIGIRQCQRAFEQRHPGVDVCALKPSNPALAQQVADVQAACRTALPSVLQTVRGVGQLGKPLHFHLHDGHPSSIYSIYGVSDHLSFFQEIPIPFSWEGSRTLPTLYGPLGLASILAEARKVLSGDRLSCTLEIHIQEGRLDLGEYASLFQHWRIKDNAERMNYWIEMLLRNHRLLRAICS